MKTCTQGAERKGANQKAQRASIRKRFYIMKTRTSKLAAIFTSVALAATMLASCGGSSDKITVISREDGSGTRDDELSQGIKSVTIAQDAIAVIVNKDNAVDDITMDEIKAIYTGSKTTWSDESK